ncbi:hypothetical protein AB9F44_34295, partial [Rhizobium leguminosarum]|uniref:hypothetical protein n=1 Tax=Rhizobium leguminosarum TaxID=384 RepID=UPI003F9688E1
RASQEMDGASKSSISTGGALTKYLCRLSEDRRVPSSPATSPMVVHLDGRNIDKIRIHHMDDVGCQQEWTPWHGPPITM